MDENLTPPKESYIEVPTKEETCPQDNSKTPIYSPPTISQAINFSQDSYTLDCPFCNQHCSTKTIKKRSKLQYISISLLILLPPLCIVPCLLSSCYDKFHYCNQCNNQIGCHKSFSRSFNIN